MKRDYRDHGATWADYLDTKPGMYANWKEAARGLGGILILALLFLAIFSWGLF